MDPPCNYNTPRNQALNPPLGYGGTTQTLRGVVIPSPPSSFPTNVATMNAANARSNGTPIDRSRPVQPLKRKPSTSNPQASSKKSRHLHGADGDASIKHAPVMSSKQIMSKELPVDYRLLLLSLADQYIAGARSLGSHIAVHGLSAAHVEQRCKLVATALGCLETVLKEKQAWRLQPRQEAVVMLKYCTLLFEETDNDGQAETVLTKGVALCDRHRFFDLKYSMQYLLARYMFKSSSPKAMEAYLDTVIKDVETYQHTVWLYAFLFLRVSLLLSLPAKAHNAGILRDLTKIFNAAKRRRDPSIGAIAATLEALVHLRNRNNNWLDDAQHAIAAARSQQHSASGSGLTQVETMIYILDISCSLNPYDYKQSQQKMHAMHDYFKSTPQAKKDHNILSIPIGPADEPLVVETAGVFTRLPNGQLNLTLTWISPLDLFVLGSLVSSLALCRRNAKERRSEPLLRDSLLHLESNDWISRAHMSQPPALARAIALRRRSLYSYVILHQTLLQSDREDWPSAQRSLAEYKTYLKTYEQDLEPSTRETLTSITSYLIAVMAQGTGDISLALKLYTTAPLALSQLTGRESTTPTTTLAILSTFNALLIIHPPHHPHHSLIPTLTDRLKPYFSPNTPFIANPHLVAAYTFIQSVVLSPSTSQPPPTPTSPPTPTRPQVQILPTKQLLQRSLNLSKTAGNTELFTLTLAFVHHAFFSGQVGPQALSAARSARTTAVDGARGLWIAVCDGVVSGVMERMGMHEEAKVMLQEGLAVRLPEKLLGS